MYRKAKKLRKEWRVQMDQQHQLLESPPLLILQIPLIENNLIQ